MSIIKTSSSTSTSLSVKEGFVVSTNKFSFSINSCNFKRAKDKKRLTKYKGNIRENRKNKILIYTLYGLHIDSFFPHCIISSIFKSFSLDAFVCFSLSKLRFIA